MPELTAEGARHRRGPCTTPRRQRGRWRGAARGVVAGGGSERSSTIPTSAAWASGRRRHGHGRQHVQQRAEGAGGRALRRARRAASCRRPPPPTVAPASPKSQGQPGGIGVGLFVPDSLASAEWWPASWQTGLGRGENELRYAFFPAARRLAIARGGQVTFYDTGDHRIGGFAQQQSGDQSLTLTSQHGLVRMAELPAVGGSASPAAPTPAAPAAPAGGGRHLRQDRAPGGAARQGHPDRPGVRGKEGRAAQPALRAPLRAREALLQLDPLWDELFPTEQARIMQLLVERVDVRMHGVEVMRPNGSLGWCAKSRDNRRAAA